MDLNEKNLIPLTPRQAMRLVALATIGLETMKNMKLLEPFTKAQGKQDFEETLRGIAGRAFSEWKWMDSDTKATSVIEGMNGVMQDYRPLLELAVTAAYSGPEVPPEVVSKIFDEVVKET